MRLQSLFVTALALALAAPAGAQERPRAEARQGREAEQEARRRQEAVRRLEQAQRELRDALEQLRKAETALARERLDEVMRALREAQRDLRDDMRVWRTEVLAPMAAVFSADVDRPRMGVVLSSRSEGDSVGVKLQAVTPGGPAAEAGLRAGDVITHANGQALARRGARGAAPGERLVNIVRELDEGDTLKVTYRRDDQTRTANVAVRKLGAFPQAFQYSFTPESSFVTIRPTPQVSVAPITGGIDVAPTVSWALPFGWLDMELVQVNEGLAGYFGTSQGLLVVRAPKEESLQLRSGDVLLAIDGREPSSPSHALRILRSYSPGETMRLEIMRDKRRQTLTVTIPERGRGFYWP